MARLAIGDGVPEAKYTEQLRAMKKLPAKAHGDFGSAMTSAGYYAKKMGQTMHVYRGNSYGHRVWRVSYKPGEYLNPINNDGGELFSVTPELEVARHQIFRNDDGRFVSEHVSAPGGTADRKRWDSLRAALQKAQETRSEFERQIREKYGSNFQSYWLSAGHQKKLESLKERENKAGDKIVEMIVKVSPRGDRWLSGVPSWWLVNELTWEDMIRPANEPLSVVVPGAWGYRDGHMSEHVRAPRDPGLHLWKFNRRTRVWDFQRDITPGTSSDWKRKFERDEPGEAFAVSPERPTRVPAMLGEGQSMATRRAREGGSFIQIPVMPIWEQIDGDVSPDKYGGTFAKSDGDAIELLKIQPVREYVGDEEAADVGHPFWTREAYYDVSDLDPSRDEVRQALGTIDMNRSDLEELTPIQRTLTIASALLDYGSGVDEGPSGWSTDIYGDMEVKTQRGNKTTFAELLSDEDDEFRRDVLGEDDDEDEDEDEDE